MQTTHGRSFDLGEEALRLSEAAGGFMDVRLANQTGDFGDPLMIILISGIGTAVVIIGLIVFFIRSRRK
jgi:hypothetical protein